MASAGPLIRFPTRQMPGPVKVAGRCQLLAPLGSTLRSLKLLGNIMEPGDWETICSGMTRLTVRCGMRQFMAAVVFPCKQQHAGRQQHTCAHVLCRSRVVIDPNGPSAELYLQQRHSVLRVQYVSGQGENRVLSLPGCS